MSFIFIDRLPSKPIDACANICLLETTMSFYNDKESKPDLFKLIGIVNKVFAEGCCVWPSHGHHCEITVKNRVAFEWLKKHLEENPDPVSVSFLANTASGFHSFLAVPFPGECPCQQGDWMVCWRRDELFGHADVTAMQACLALYTTKSREMELDEPISAGRSVDQSDASETENIQLCNRGRPCEAVFKTVVDLCPHCLFLCETDGSLSQTNVRAVDAFGDMVRPGLPSTQSIAWLANIVHPDDLSRMVEAWRTVQSWQQSDPGTDQVVENCRLVFEDGRASNFRIIIKPVFAESTDGRRQNLTNWLLYAMDADRARDLERERALSQSRTRFLAEMSHEIRTPLSCIIGTVDLFRHTALQPEQIDLLTTIRSCSRQLFQLIENVLDYSKIHDNKLILNPQSVIPERLLQDAAEMCAPEMHRKDLDFFLRIDPAVPECIVIDELRLRQVLTNLIANAVKFTDPGTMVQLTLGGKHHADSSRSPSKPQELELKFEIEDRGPGLSEGDNRTLFESFVQLNETVQSKFGGTGLGLAISKVSGT